MKGGGLLGCEVAVPVGGAGRGSLLLLLLVFGDFGGDIALLLQDSFAIARYYWPWRRMATCIMRRCICLLRTQLEGNLPFGTFSTAEKREG